MYKGIELIVGINSTDVLITAEFSISPNKILYIPENHKIILPKNLISVVNDKHQIMEEIKIKESRLISDLYDEVVIRLKSFLNDREGKVEYAQIWTDYEGKISMNHKKYAEGTFSFNCNLFRDRSKVPKGTILLTEV